MGLIDLFNQWIVERGSAVVQEKQLALFRDQLVIADKKIASLESENVVLKTENTELKAKSKQLTKDNNELKKKIQTYEKPSHDDSLPQEQVKILIFLAENKEQMFSLATIMAKCALSEHKAIYHIQKLEEAFLITSQYGDGEDYYLLDDDGRAYLIEHDLIS